MQHNIQRRKKNKKNWEADRPWDIFFPIPYLNASAAINKTGLYGDDRTFHSNLKKKMKKLKEQNKIKHKKIAGVGRFGYFCCSFCCHCWMQIRRKISGSQINSNGVQEPDRVKKKTNSCPMDFNIPFIQHIRKQRQQISHIIFIVLYPFFRGISM